MFAYHLGRFLSYWSVRGDPCAELLHVRFMAMAMGEVGMNQTVNGTSGDDTLYGGVGDDVVSGLDGNDLLFGVEGVDTLFGGAGDDTLRGGEGDDWLNISTLSGVDYARLDEDFGPMGVDTLIGGEDDDVMLGLGDGTVFRVSEGDGFDMFLGGLGFQEIEMVSPATAPVTIGIAAIHGVEKIAATHSGVELILSVTGDADFSLTALHNVVGIYGDGTDNVITGTSSSQGTSLNDTMFGGGGEDVLAGGRGNDELTGGFDNDSFVFGVSEGSDIIRDFDDGIDVINLQKTNATGFGDLLITSENDGEDTRIVVDKTEILVEGVGIGSIDASDFSFSTSHGTRFQDTIVGSNGSNQIFGYEHNDILFGERGRDRLFGGGGADKLFGGVSSDTLDGGAGLDRYYGGEGDDTLVFARDDVRDLVYGFQNGIDVIDMTFFGGLTFGDLDISFDGNHWTKIVYVGQAHDYQMWIRGDYVSAGQLDESDFLF